MALDPCVRRVLCTLGAPVLISVRATVQPVVPLLEALRAQLQARLALLQIQVIPIQLARDTALLVLEQAQSVANLLPLGIIEDCADLGDVNAKLARGVEQATSAVEDLADDATRALTIETDLSAEIAELTNTINDINEFLEELNFCITQVQLS